VTLGAGWRITVSTEYVRSILRRYHDKLGKDGGESDRVLMLLKVLSSGMPNNGMEMSVEDLAHLQEIERGLGTRQWQRLVESEGA